jgi:hypothetical protein
MSSSDDEQTPEWLASSLLRQLSSGSATSVGLHVRQYGRQSMSA